ncbi:MAG: NAD(P)/FAD-dependent oxidoreductase [Pseudomonadota bacterium]
MPEFTRVPHVLIVGAGFAGLYAARALARQPVRVTVMDQRNHHLFQPLLYQLATAGLQPSDIAAPTRQILRGMPNVTVLMGRARAVDLQARQVHLSERSLGYDYLVVAAGATHDYFGHPEWARHAPGLKSIEDALEIQGRVLLAYEAAERETDPERRRAWLTFVVVGAGPTGVELAGALGEIAHRTLARDFKNFDPRETRVVLLDGGDRVLGTFPEDLSAKARRQLESLGVEVRTGALVRDIDEHGVTLQDGRLDARTVIWAAGVRGSPLGEALGAPVDRRGRVKVAPDLSLPGHPEVFVVGDLACLEQDGQPIPGVAPAAIQMGRWAAHNILRRVAGEASAPFRYLDKGSLATIGRARGVARFGQLAFSGIVAWWLWLAIHIFFLIGFRNRFVVMLEWTWAYWTFDRSNRVILRQSFPWMPGSEPSLGQLIADRGDEEEPVPEGPFLP